MDEPSFLPTVTERVRVIDAQTIFAALSDETRRRLLVALFDGQWHAAGSFGGTVKGREVIRKHLEVLVKAGLVVAEPDPAFRKRQRFQLAPSVRAATSPEGRRTMDFGYCIVRC
jgi:DNA-binding transcriptional ArsR family regulator